ncbi:similar to Saccharomyces cerevisiae YOR104W PIN2 Protein that induces appearance of [PIN+] prion when overproduced [Maudiozyma barnettii]|uniref:Similar to Saccharomyces cerevisiae YOR104W PIN2 Protein that induces appearance of [PIN+] prion when overproduced n=1 Tax=Maudiozyma barnettii TaxID=61262 RepID=A0A8H2VEP7_9SACH|nr:similar to Saccharomyces cerevisiae YOR104W PIN2 Protein that induces appearance of [PIN+] prion when overproduced [Kazachstania barnettii]CAB4254224.1 similar to Saccharomyces cerevisiae YOR104W PIN2 Protein that induces appearance of [PIN+] prion when overproduced [Kazachstania barnettii]CAD1781959.1 similar to Saccharomyces cerevisiae YOR104W PIN2 Protein that induces appearance of [PIN+] prion when overproduced [Kazachstania barnettii]
MSFCKISNAIYPRDFTDDLKNTGKSFKNWNSCMNDKACKIIAIVGIVLAVIVGLWLIGGLLTCFRQGVTGIAEFCCWCCHWNDNRNNNNPNMMMNNNGYAPPGMPNNNGYQPAPDIVYQPIRYPESAYYANNDNGKDAYYDEGATNGKSNKDSEVFEMEQDFDLEGQRRKSLKRQNKNVVYDLESEDPVRDSFVNNAGSTTYLNSNYTTSATHLDHTPGTLNNNSNVNIGQSRPYPEDSYFQTDPYGPNQYNNNSNGHNTGYYY